MNNLNIANPAPLGLAGFGLTTAILSLINAGVLGADAIGVVLGLAIAYGGGAQLIAGLWEFRRGNTFAATAFTSFGAFWLSFYFIEHANASAAGVATYLFFWGLFTLCLWIASFNLNRTLFFVFLTLTIMFLLLAFGAWGAASLTTLGGWFGLISGLLALYASAAEVINETSGRNMIPLGKPVRGVRKV